VPERQPLSKRVAIPRHAVNGAAMTVDVLTPSHDQRSGTPSPHRQESRLLRSANSSRLVPSPCIVKFAVQCCYYRKAQIMGARRLAGLAILAAVAPIAVLLGSSPAHADPSLPFTSCPNEGAKVWGDDGPVQCMRQGGGLEWEPIEPLVEKAPPGYRADACRPSANPPPSPNAVSSVDCLNNTLPGGPPVARYEMFADQNTLNSAFQSDARGAALQPCPGSSDPAPGTWNATNPPPANGSVMCYTSNDNMAHVEWTNTPDLVKANASGPDMASLYGWWHGLITTA
jgi:hypothetical protein